MSLGCAAIGSTARGARRARLETSPEWRDGRFRNRLERMDASILRTAWSWFTEGDENAAPSAPQPPWAGNAAELAAPPASGLRVTWLGHSSLLVEIDGHRVLVDPMWGPRSSPFSWAGPKRFFAPPLALDALPDLDAVVISHDHYDHLDHRTALALNARGARFVVPLGVGAHLEHWGVPASRIVELDWWQSETIGDLTLTATPARHFSGRSLVLSDADQSLWAGWAMRGPVHRAYYSGDTAMSPGLTEIGERLGPFDVAMIEAGAYDPLWRDVHLGPEQAVVAAELVGARLLVPVHWGTFDLALHGWTEPVERLLAAAARLDVRVAVPRPGQGIEPDAAPPVVRWWPELPWRDAGKHAVMSTGLPSPLEARIRQAHGIQPSMPGIEAAPRAGEQPRASTMEQDQPGPARRP